MAAHKIIFLALWFLSCGYAAVRGGAPERATAATMAIALVVTWICILLRSSARLAYSSVETGIALTDFSAFLAILAIALASTRFWPLLMASMLGCGLLGHLTKPLGPDILPRAYYITATFWAYPQVLLLAVATWRHRSRVRRYGLDHAWVWQLPRRYRDGWSVNELARPLPQN